MGAIPDKKTLKRRIRLKQTLQKATFHPFC